MKTLVATLLLCFAAFAQSASVDEPGPFTAGEVASWCEPYRTALLVGANVTVNATTASQVCLGAFMTIQQLITTTSPWHPKESMLQVCSPATSRLVELIKVFLHYTDEHPEFGHLKFTDVALSALWKAYPCQASR